MLTAAERLDSRLGEEDDTMAQEDQAGLGSGSMLLVAATGTLEQPGWN